MEPDIQVDEQGMFVSCEGTRRVQEVWVLQEDGSYTELDPDSVYTMASHNYLIKEGGDGLNMFMDNTLIMGEGMLDYQVLITYLTDLLGGAVTEEYAETQSRITVK